MLAEKMTVGDFMELWFNKDYAKYSAEDFSVCHSEFIDISKQFLSKEFDLSTYINYLKGRVNNVVIFCFLQREFLKEFGEPFKDYISFLRKYGHNPTWKNDEADFEKQLAVIELREGQYRTKLKNAQKQLDEEKKKKNNGEEVSERESRHNFIKRLNSLQKEGYMIDKAKTTVEEFALAILQNNEEITRLTKPKDKSDGRRR